MQVDIANLDSGYMFSGIHPDSQVCWFGRVRAMRPTRVRNKINRPCLFDAVTPNRASAKRETAYGGGSTIHSPRAFVSLSPMFLTHSQLERAELVHRPPIGPVGRLAWAGCEMQ
jgi:hypothetical protein